MTARAGVLHWDLDVADVAKIEAQVTAIGRRLGDALNKGSSAGAPGLAKVSQEASDASKNIARLAQQLDLLINKQKIGKVDAAEYASRLERLGKGIRWAGDQAGLSAKDYQSLATMTTKVQREQEKLAGTYSAQAQAQQAARVAASGNAAALAELQGRFSKLNLDQRNSTITTQQYSSGLRTLLGDLQKLSQQSGITGTQYGRLNTLTKQAQAAHAALSGTISQTSRQSDAAGQRIARLAHNFAALKLQFDTNKVAVDTYRARLDDLQQGVERTANLTGLTTAQYQALSAVQRGVTSEQERLNATYSAAAQAQQAARAQVEANASAISRLQARYNQLNADQRLNSLSTRDYSAGMKALFVDLQKVAQQAGLTGAQYGRLNALARQVQTAHATLGGTLPQVVAGVKALQQEASNLRNNWQNTGQDTEKVKTRLREIAEEAVRAAEGLRSLDDGSTRFGQQIKQYEIVGRYATATVAGMEGRISRLGLASQVSLGAIHALQTQLYQFGPIGQVMAGALGRINAQIGGISLTTIGVMGALAGSIVTLRTVLRTGLPEVRDFQQSLRIMVADGAGFSESGLVEALEQVRDLAGEAGRIFSRAEMSVAMSELVKAGLDARDALQLLAPSMQLAAITGDNLNDTSARLLANLRQFRLDVSEAARVADAFAAADLNAAETAKELAEGLSVVGPVARAAGFSLEQTLAILVELNNAGLGAANIAATALRSNLSQLLSPTASAKQVMSELGVELRDVSGTLRPLRDVLFELLEAMENNAEAARIAADIFDTRALVAILNMTEGSNELAEALENSRGKASEFVRTLAANNLKIAEQARSAAWRDLAQDLTLGMTPAIIAANRALESFFRTLDRMPALFTSPIRNMQDAEGSFSEIATSAGLSAAAVGLFVAAVPRLTAVFSSLLPVLLRFLGPAGVLAGLTTGFLKLNQMMDAGAETRRQSQESFDGLLTSMTEYRDGLLLTSEAEREAAVEALTRQRQFLLATIANQRAYMRAVEADVIAFANKGFFGQLFSFGAANVDLRTLDQLDAQLGELEGQLATVDAAIAQILNHAPGATVGSLGVVHETMADLIREARVLKTALDNARDPEAWIAADDAARAFRESSTEAARAWDGVVATMRAESRSGAAGDKTPADILNDLTKRMDALRERSLALGDTLESRTQMLTGQISAVDSAIGDLIDRNLDHTDERIQELVRQRTDLNRDLAQLTRPSTADTKVWIDRLGAELTLGIKGFQQVIDLLSPRLASLRVEATEALSEFGIESQQYQDIAAKIGMVEGLLGTATSRSEARARSIAALYNVELNQARASAEATFELADEALQIQLEMGNLSADQHLEILRARAAGSKAIFGEESIEAQRAALDVWRLEQQINQERSQAIEARDAQLRDLFEAELARTRAIDEATRRAAEAEIKLRLSLGDLSLDDYAQILRDRLDEVARIWGEWSPQWIEARSDLLAVEQQLLDRSVAAERSAADERMAILEEEFLRRQANLTRERALVDARYQLMVEFGEISLEEQAEDLRLVQMQFDPELDPEWYELESRIRRILQQIADGVAADARRASDERMAILDEEFARTQAHLAAQRTLQDNQYAWELQQGLISREEHLENLRIRLLAEEMYSDEWMRLQAEIARVEAQGPSRLQQLQRDLIALRLQGFEPTSEAVKDLVRQINELLLLEALQELSSKGVAGLSAASREILRLNGILGVETIPLMDRFLTQLGVLGGDIPAGVSAIAQGLREIATAGSDADKVISGLTNVFQGLTSLAKGIGSSNPWDVAKGVAGTIGSVISMIPGMPAGLGALAEAAVGFVQVVGQGISDLFTGDSSVARAIREGLKNAVQGGFAEGIMAGIRGEENWQDNLRNSLRVAFLTALIDAFVRNQIVSAVFGPIMMEYSKFIARGQYEEAAAFLGTHLPAAIERGLRMAEDFMGSIPAGLFPTSPSGGPDPDPTSGASGYALPTAAVRGIAAPAWATDMLIAGTSFREGAELFSDAVDALVSQGILIRGGGGGRGGGSSAAARAV